MEGRRDYQFCQNCEDSFEMFAEISQTADEEEIRMKILAQMKRILEEKGLGLLYMVSSVQQLMELLSVW